jgi:predicted Ser/Thr protein kinase
MKLDWQMLAPYCHGDQDFFETPGRIADEGERLAVAARPAPGGWHRRERDLWVGIHPDAVTLPRQGWKIHISAEAGSVERACEQVWDYCVEQGIGFKFLRSHRAVRLMNSKYVLRSTSGKIITIYPVTEEQLSRAVGDLARLLDGIRGPYILSDLRIGEGPVFVRFGSFVAQALIGSDGEPTPALTAPDGSLVPETRGPVFTVPDWVVVPPVLQPAIVDAGSGEGGRFPYQIDGALHFSNSGGVYKARDEHGVRVAIREARPMAAVDADGDDAVARLRREFALLDRLAGLDCVPRVIEYRLAWEHHFLVEEFIEGETLLDAILRTHPMIWNPDPTEEQLAAYSRWAEGILERVARAVREIHARGVRMGDLHPSNVMVRPDGDVVLIDFEFARLLDEPSAPFGAPGFVPPSGARGPEADLYQLDALRLFTFIPVNMRLDRAPGQLERVRQAVAADFPTRPGGAVLLRHHGEAVGVPDSSVRLTGAELDWTGIRDSLVAGIHAAATPDRPDRLFPGGPEQFVSGGYTLAYGAAGVLRALHAVGENVPHEYTAWLARAALDDRAARPGLYDGLHGVALTLLDLGDEAGALQVFDRAQEREAQVPALGVFGGSAGFGLNALRFARHTGDPALLDKAVRYAEQLATAVEKEGAAAMPHRGLLRGSAGAALLHMHLHEYLGDDRYLDLAEQALRAEARAGEWLANGTFQLVDPGARKRYLIYLDGGSAGWALAAHEYLRRRDDAELSRAVDGVRLACRSRFVREPGLIRGRAGFIAALSRLGTPADLVVARDQVRRLAWHVQPYRGHLAFPGLKLLRLSMDLATGSAGILLALGSVLAPAGLDVLPFVETRLIHPAREGR